MSPDRRRALLVAAVGFLQLRERPPQVAPLRRCLDSWSGAGAIMTGMTRQGPDVVLMSLEPTRWQASFLEANPHGGAHLMAGYAEDMKPARAIQRAAWYILRRG